MVSTFPPPPATVAPLPIEPLDDLRDLSGNATTTTTMLRANRASGHQIGHPHYVFAQCSLSAARNLLRNERLPRSFLVARQAHGAGNDRSEQPDGEIRFPDWPSILRPLLRDGEAIVQFDPTLIGASELLHDLRLAACSYAATTHVIAIHRHEALVGGRVTFRRYDNDSHARQRGTYELTNARRLAYGRGVQWRASPQRAQHSIALWRPFVHARVALPLSFRHHRRHVQRRVVRLDRPQGWEGLMWMWMGH
ncbi:hypothetical protein OAO87_03990 [bacterium]|nr:hypothetical protein [bacterium]